MPHRLGGNGGCQASHGCISQYSSFIHQGDASPNVQKEAGNPRVLFAPFDASSLGNTIGCLEVSLNNGDEGSLLYPIRNIQREAYKTLKEDLLFGFKLPGGLFKKIFQGQLKIHKLKRPRGGQAG